MATIFTNGSYDELKQVTNNININFKEVKTDEKKNFNESKQIIEIPTAKRHAIKINDITAERNIYQKTNIIKTGELIKNKNAKSIAIYVNEFIPSYYDTNKTYVYYYLKINGIEYEIVPINSQRNGKKIIKVSDYDFNTDYIEYLTEEIVSASLTIKIVTQNQYSTPYLGNLKILIGDKNV